jgi:hypothetical protein
MPPAAVDAPGARGTAVVRNARTTDVGRGATFAIFRIQAVKDADSTRRTRLHINPALGFEMLDETDGTGCGSRSDEIGELRVRGCPAMHADMVFHSLEGIFLSSGERKRGRNHGWAEKEVYLYTRSTTLYV